MTWEVRVGDCRALMAEMEDCSVDAVVCDPPYELNFMGKGWDASGIAYDQEVWKQALRVLKPGGHLLAFSGSRTYHRMTVAIEDAGFEIRDQIMWVYGSGFPKSHDVSKAIDKAAGVEREVIGSVTIPGYAKSNVENGQQSRSSKEFDVTSKTAITPEAQQWQGWGTALKPAHEPICMARKPLETTVAGNVLKHGVGGLNIDGCRVEAPDGYTENRVTQGGDHFSVGSDEKTRGTTFNPNQAGRFPANLIHDGSDEVLALFPHTKSGYTDGTKSGVQRSTFGKYGAGTFAESYGDEGSAARFFYTAKASQWDRNGGLDDLDDKPSAASEFRPNHAEKAAMGEDGNPYGRWSPRKNIHPTVKPTDLMRYLCRLVTPPNGLVLDPFCGSGPTGRAALLEGFSFIGCELSEEYAEIARGRIAYVEKNKDRALVKPKPVEHNPYKIDLF